MTRASCVGVAGIAILAFAAAPPVTLFEDRSDKAGASGKGYNIGVAAGDFDNDGWIDIFVANDTALNFLFQNERNGRFREMTLEAGVALKDDGKATSSMGADFRDLDNDGWEDRTSLAKVSSLIAG